MAKKKIFGKMLDLIGLEETDANDEDTFDYDDDMSMDLEGEDEFTSRRRMEEDEFDDFEDEPSYSFSRKDSVVRNRREKSASRSRDREPEPEFSRTIEPRESKVVGLAPNPNNKMKMIVYQPMTYDDTQNIIDNLKNRKPVIVNLESLEIDTAQRILDFMSGAVYALNGNIHKISKGIFILVPNNVDIAGNIPDELKGKSFYTLGSKQRRDY